MYRWLTRNEVAQKLGIHPNTLFRLEKKPEFPRRSTALGGPRWREDEIDRYMERGRPQDMRVPHHSESSAQVASFQMRGVSHGE